MFAQCESSPLIDDSSLLQDRLIQNQIQIVNKHSIVEANATLT
jgi:hypothetical protein